MPKRSLSLLLSLMLLLGLVATPAAGSADEDIRVFVDGGQLAFDVPPTVIEGRTLVPMRAIFEALGADVGWDGATSTVTGTLGDQEISLQIGSAQAQVSGQITTLDVPAQLIDGRTLVPLRFVGEALGAAVGWDGETRTITITSRGPPIAAPASGATRAAPITVHFIDVGQGDATLFDSPDCNILIDAGRHTGSEVVPYIRSVGVEELNLLIGTHPHADHIGQFSQVLEAFPVGEVWMSGWEQTTLTFERAIDATLASFAGYHEPRAGETRECGSLVLEVIHPVDPLEGVHDNIAVRVIYGDVAFVLTGDAEIEHEHQMIARSHDLQATVLQLGHHGSRTSTSREFLLAVQPELAIYSAGAGNSYGHPHDEVLARLANLGIEVYGTDTHGTIIIGTDGSEFEIRTQKVAGPRAPPIVELEEEPTPAPEPAPPISCVDLNTASLEELQQIQHIGPDRAQDIINGRPWQFVDQLTRISGIAAGRLSDIKEQGLACVR